MHLYIAVLLPSALTILAAILGWIYLRNSAQTASSKWSSNTEQKGKKITEEILDSKEEETDKVSKEDFEPYLINPSDIHVTDATTTLDNETIEKEMRDKGMENIQTYYKASRLKIKEIESQLSGEEREVEREAQKKQLEDIFKLMATQKEKFGVDCFEDVQDQMKLYSQ